ncbi:type VI secretion system baseplate subunit TssK [Variovorax dokdonensis]|uniref:Type VI secretion system baseplate subunit TssK n=1 Tax=Variovorax dokdonensis TaxID=344883 RepID=A0ABT7NHH8_9BURK|nr:type VI secretion system baseplate subunit TssK [Variovorax dokdonensis]MDM0047285.1 type VI secretion system baseplate subunit TssK [Variovorax dokdonensis]
MSWFNKITWSEGQFLRPQLFQQQERYLEHYAHKRALALGQFFWGFTQFAIDTESLALGKLVVASASGIFSDGTPFDTPGQTRPPSPLTILPEHLEQIIHLAVPIRAPNSEETTFDDGHGAAGASLARYGVFEHELRDANSVGQGPKPVQLSRLRLRLLPERELTDAWIGLPIARVTSLRSDGSIAIDHNLIPPVSGFAASTLLKDWVNNLHGLCKLRAESLANRLSGNDGKSTEAAEVSDFLLLQVLNRYEPLLSHWLLAGETSPEHVYTALRQLASELSTYVRASTRRPRQHPPYQHVNPYASFRELVADVQMLLNDVLVRSAQNIAVTERANGVRLASIDPAELQGYASLVFAVAGHMPPDQLAQQFPARTKVGPSDRLADIIRSNLPGIVLQTLPVPPRQIPFNAGFVYFELQQRGPLWEQLLKSGGLAMHVAGEFPGLRLELWGVRNK